MLHVEKQIRVLFWRVNRAKFFKHVLKWGRSLMYTTLIEFCNILGFQSDAASLYAYTIGFKLVEVIGFKYILPTLLCWTWSLLLLTCMIQHPLVLDYPRVFIRRFLEISHSHFGHSASFIGPKNEMYYDVLSDQMFFLSENPIRSGSFQELCIRYQFLPVDTAQIVCPINLEELGRLLEK